MDIKITVPFNEKETSKLNAGDYVYISGIIYTARDAAHKRMYEALQNKEALPMEMKDNVIYYKDLIKIGVSLEDGSIVSFDATGYLMNHITRDSQSNIISESNARNSLSKKLEITHSSMAYIPTSGLAEVLCYEFECKGENNDRVLVYINAITGLEEQIYVLMESDNGTLVM